MLTGVLCIYIVLVLLFRLRAAGDDPVGAVLSIGAFLARSSRTLPVDAVDDRLIMLMASRRRTRSC